MTGRNLLSPVLTEASRDVEAYDSKVTAAQARAAESASTSAARQETAAAKVTAANTRSAESSSTAADKVVAANARAAESSRAFGEVTESSVARAHAAWSSLATVGLPLVAGAVAVVTGKMAGDYQQLITKLETTAGESKANLSTVSQGLLDMAGQVGVSADDLAKGMYTVESAGYHGADGLKVEKAAAQGAKQETADLAKTTDALTTILHDYNLQASDSPKVMSELVTAVSHGKTTLEDFTGSLHSVTPLASQLHIPLADLLGTLSAMTASGESADQATQNMADALRHLMTPLPSQVSELASLGITAQDMSDKLGTRGLAGTMQDVSEAILTKMGPSGKVLLDAFNQSKQASNDLQVMIGAMPPQLAAMSRGLLDGSMTLGAYTKATGEFGGQAGAMGKQFLSLYKTSDGFNQALKSGGPAAQSYTTALQKATGTVAGMTVALQVTGEHTAAVDDAIKDIAGSAGDAAGNIKGWDEVQGNFNTKLDQAAAGAKSLAIEAGQQLLPVLTDVVGWVGSTGIPAIGHLGGAVGDVVHWFMQLPGPVKEAAVALGIVKVLGASDMFAGLLASGRVFAVGFANDMSNLVASARAGAGQVTAAFAEAKVAQRELTAAKFGIDTSELPRATGDIAGLGAAAGAAAKGGLSALKAGASGLMGLFGGPWGVALIGATVGVTALMNNIDSAIEKHDEKIKQATADVTAWQRAASLNPGGGSAVNAQQHLIDLQDQLTAAQGKLNSAQTEYQNLLQQAPRAAAAFGSTINPLKQNVADLSKELGDGRKAWDDQLTAMTPVQEMQARVDAATTDLNNALKNNAPNSQLVTNASMRLQDAQHMLALETNQANDATKTQAQLQQDAADATMANLDASRGAQEATLQFVDAVEQYNKDVADGQHTTRQLKEEQLGLVDSAIRTAKAAADAADAQDKQNGITDTAHDKQVALIKSLQESAAQLDGPGKQAILDYINQLSAQQSAAVKTSGAISTLGVTVINLPSEHLIQIDVPTAQQENDLHQLGYVTTHLPNGQVVVTADTHPAQAAIQDLLNYARQQSITFRAGLATSDPLPGTSQRMGTYAEGGYTGPGGKFTPAGIVHAGEIVFSQADVARHGGVAQVESMRLGPGYADGGVVIPAYIDQGSLTAMRSQLRGLAQQAGSMFSGGGGGAGSPAIRALGQQIAASMGYGGQFSAIDYIFSHESGWNPTAQNPTSTAYGIPQFLNSTWAAYGGKTNDAGTQIRDGIRYMTDRYGSPNGAASFWQAHHWYDQGGVLNPGVTLAVNGTGKPETIRTFEQEQAVQARLGVGYNQAGTMFAPAAMPGYGMASASGTGGGMTAPQITVQARVFIGDREITDIARVEATTVVVGALDAVTGRMTANP